MLSRVIVHSIALYQRHLSPHKGFCCAHHMLTGEASCSEFARQQIIANGIWGAWDDIRTQFGRCQMAAESIEKEQDENTGKGKSCSFGTGERSLDKSASCNFGTGGRSCSLFK